MASPLIAEIQARLNQAHRVVVITHIQPDGDAIGSLLGLANALRERGRPVQAVVDGGVPGFLRFLPGSEIVGAELSSGEWDVMVSLDSSAQATFATEPIAIRVTSR